MVEDLVKKLLESGVHFGHQTQRWNPKMKKFIFGERSGIYIIDLEKTADRLKKAQEFVQEIAGKGGRVLFVGTKKQAKMTVEEEAQDSEMHYISSRWLGGLLTNFDTVKKSIERLEEIEEMAHNGIWENLKKKEIARLNKEKEKLLRDLGGIREMKTLPEVVFIVDPKKEDIAVKEAKKLGIPIVAIVDTNCDPDSIDYPIPGNDDALKSIRFITNLISQSVKEGRKEFIASKLVVEEAASTEESAAGEADSSAAASEKSESKESSPEKSTPEPQQAS